MAAIVRNAAQRALLTSCNHPKPFGPEWTFRDVTGYHCIEVWNGPWAVNNQAALDFWLSQLAQGKRIPAVGGSDFHRERDRTSQPSRDLGTPTAWVRAPHAPTEATILDAIRAGHVSLSADPGGPLLELSAAPVPRPAGAPPPESRAAMQGDVLSRPADGLLPVCVRYRRCESAPVAPGAGGKPASAPRSSRRAPRADHLRPRRHNHGHGGRPRKPLRAGRAPRPRRGDAGAHQSTVSALRQHADRAEAWL